MNKLHQQYINLGWHTAPLKGELRRLENGKKTIPTFEKGWLNKYSKTRLTKPYPLALAITGAVSNIIAIDCDNKQTFDLFRSLDPEYTFFFKSLGKEGGTIIYKYFPIATFHIADDNMLLDLQSDQACIYLPTEANYTKTATFITPPPIKDPPLLVKNLLLTLSKKTVMQSRDEKTKKGSQTNSLHRLAPLLDKALADNTYNPTLFRIITPKSFRDLPLYQKQQHLHPNDIPMGRGSEYLSKLSAILATDISVSRELYHKTMTYINSLWTSPMEEARLLQTIINPMIEGKTVINGEVAWQYDKYWQQLGFIGTALNGDYIESFFDDIKSTYYLVNYSKDYTKTFSNKRDCISHIKSLLGTPLSEAQYDQQKNIVNTTVAPQLEFGHNEDRTLFNIFKQKEELAILTDPSLHKRYVEPLTIIQYFKTLVPDDKERDYLLRFIRTKLTTFKYSPVILYLLGAHGSGKDTLISILATILGEHYIAKPDARVFLEQYNGWLQDKFIIQLDEYGNKLTRTNDKNEALGKLKSYSGSESIQIRAMRSDGITTKHTATFILTANSNPLPIEAEDRRIALFNTPNRLDLQDWVKKAGGIADVINLIHAEIKDFCYYLATEYKNLPSDEYVVAPVSEKKMEVIMEAMPVYKRLAHYIVTRDFKTLEELGFEYGIDDISVGWNTGRILASSIEDLYSAITEGKGSTIMLTKELGIYGLRKTRSTRGNKAITFYYVAGLKDYELNKSIEPIEPIEGEEIKPIVDLNSEDI